MKNLLKNIARLLFAGILIIPLTFWINRFHIFTLQWNHPSHSELDSYTLVLLTVSAFLLFYELIMVALDIRSQDHDASQFVKDFAKMGLIGFFINRYHAIHSANTKSKISFVLFGSFSFVFVSILTVSGAFDKQTLLFYDNVNSIQMDQHDTSKVVYYFNYFTINNDTKKYVTDLLKLAKDFKKVGVKAVVADWPGNINARDIQLISTIDSLLRGYNFVFATYPDNQFQKFIPSKKYDPNLKHPLGFSIYSSDDIGNPGNQLRTIVQWYPYRMYHQTTTGAGFVVESDVALAVAEKYFDEPNYSSFKNHFVKFENNKIISDNFIVPITSEGIAYSKLNWDWLRDSPVSASHGVGGFEQNKNVSDSLVYHFQLISGNSSYTSNKDTLQNFLPFEKYFRDRIVVMNWIDMSNSRTRSIVQKVKVGSIINSTIYSQNFERFGIEIYTISFLSIVLTGFLFYHLKSIAALIISFILIITSIGTGVLFFLYSQCIFDFLYPIIAIILSVVIFWLLKLNRQFA